MVNPDIDPTALRAAFRREIEARPEIAAAYVYGSAATGRCTPLSDVDIALLFSADVRSATERRRIASDLASSVVRSVGPLELDVRDAEALPLAVQGEVVRQGRRLASNDDARRVRFEAEIVQRYLDFLPFREASVQPALKALRKRYSRG